ncbi:DUF2924 domain-containing protein [Sphingobium subterraneum]|uniref:Uncharacterized protein n=1 Tax=Sphingobium subterraneum TaxID=627688 RepID=A0A841J3K6_9SPHN|nr:DUF2924 domain-containing protein [Sphingobium subterraneum]MBB6124922.1 hypothetical protein [Sphingobium subterraneum]
MRKAEQELAALAGLSGTQLRECRLALEKTPLPSVPEALLRRLLAQRLQERRLGGLPPLVARELERSLSRQAPTLSPSRPDQPRTLTPRSLLSVDLPLAWTDQRIALGFA